MRGVWCPTGQFALVTGVEQAAPEQMDAEGFGGCTNFGECEAVCPQGISIRVIGKLNRDHLTGVLHHPRNPRGEMLPQ